MVANGACHPVRASLFIYLVELLRSSAPTPTPPPLLPSVHSQSSVDESTRNRSSFCGDNCRILLTTQVHQVRELMSSSLPSKSTAANATANNNIRNAEGDIYGWEGDYEPSIRLQ
ncbi:hypothetical protein CDAR_297111 [Caerostris darwini]|uniref:Uncharacterized protein n=1 Tax=Caerostris darwini TaxID=1538125 RepID=A0AAV4Q8G0_9ARAC|nr:hypothetical protein CDAR_297111 [Caerostris darwini]